MPRARRRRARIAACGRRVQAAARARRRSPAWATRCGARLEPRKRRHRRRAGSRSPSRSARPHAAPTSDGTDARRVGRRRDRADACPAHHPVKAKLASGIFHVPGGANYDRTQRRPLLPAPTAAAEADGLRAAPSARQRQSSSIALGVDDAVGCARSCVDDLGGHRRRRRQHHERRRRPPGPCPRSMSSMLMPASPRMVPTRPIIPGVSSLRTTSMWLDGGRSTMWSSMATMRGRVLLAVAACRRRACSRSVVVPAELDQVHVVACRRRRRLAHDRARAPRRAAARSRTTPARRRPARARPSAPTSVSTRQS